MKTVYALFASDEPLQVRYVGITTKPLRVRLAGHLNDLVSRVRWNVKDPRRKDWMRSVIERGAKVLIRELSNHSTDTELFQAEQRWIKFWETFCGPLLNIDRVRQSAGRRKVEREHGLSH